MPVRTRVGPLVHQGRSWPRPAPSSAASTPATTTSGTTTGPTRAHRRPGRARGRCRRHGRPLSRAAQALRALRRLRRDQHRGRRPARGHRERGRRLRRTPHQDRLDGLTVDLGAWWFNLRPSNTEPLLRLNLEAATRQLRGPDRRGPALIEGPRGPSARGTPGPGTQGERVDEPSDRPGARSQAARDPRLPGGQGPAAVLRRRGSPCTTRGCGGATPSATTSRSCSSTRPTTVDDAEHDRLLAKAEADGVTPDLRAGCTGDRRRSRRRSTRTSST